MTVDYDNDLVAAGAVLMLLTGNPVKALQSIEVVTDANDMPTNQLIIGLSFLKSPYLITVERWTDDD